MIKKVQSAKRKGQSLGFTLIELLVVISIIGILSTLLMANVGGVRERARDAQRKSDINQIQKALEMYKNSQKPPVYPVSTMDALITALTGGDFMKTVPHDPKYNSTCEENCWPDYAYTRAWDPEKPDKLTYKIIACLENASDQQKDTDQADCPASCKTTAKGVCYTRNEP